LSREKIDAFRSEAVSLKVANVLPPRARAVLVAAVGVEPTKGRTESEERTKALDLAIRTIKEMYPTYFQKGK
jgi:hypothetical protein